MELTDQQLVEQCQRELPYDMTAFEVLVRRYETLVLRTCRRYLGNEQEAEEACQDAFLRVFHGLPRFQHRAEFRTWLFRIAVIHVLILIPVIVGSLTALQIAAVTGPASEMLNTILGTLPGVFAAGLVLGVAYVVGRVVSGMAVNLLSGIGFDTLPSRLGITRETPSGSRTPSQIAGTIIIAAIVLFATMQAMPMLGFDLLASMMSDFLTFASHVLVGLVIFGFGLFFAKLVADMMADSQIANSGILSTLARLAMIIMAGAMGLQQMGLAQEIVNLAFGITLGSVAVAAAIAFGIGGRDAAKSLVDRLADRFGGETGTGKSRSGRSAA